MNLLDFIIGLTLVNTLPHFVLGVWKGRILGGLGFGNLQNILYGLLNFTISVGLFIWQYGWDGLMSNNMYQGGLFVAIAYFLVGNFLYKKWHVDHQES
ncbi:MAG: hypothetical protein JXQ90_13740 [Cyclobacteriaceae bacterium]